MPLRWTLRVPRLKHCHRGSDPLRVHGAMARRVRPPRMDREWGGAWGRFRAHLSAASTRRFHQISFPGECDGAADGNRTHVCAWATHGSATEPRTLVHRAGLEPAKPIGTWFTARPRCRWRICALLLRWVRAILRSPAPRVGGRLTVRTPHLAVPTRFQDGVPATPAEPSVLDVSARLERATPAFGRRCSDPLSYETMPRPRAARPSRGSPPSSRAGSRAETSAWQPAAR